MLIAQANGIVIAAVTVFQRERTLLRRERAKKLYSVSAYFLSKTLCDMSNNVLLPVLYSMAVYWTAGYRVSVGAYLRFILSFYMTVSTAQSMGLMVSVAIPSMALALALAPPFTLFFLIMGGFYIPFEVSFFRTNYISSAHNLTTTHMFPTVNASRCRMVELAVLCAVRLFFSRGERIPRSLYSV
jgi:ABC-type multidrug transport system permease subunit